MHVWLSAAMGLVCAATAPPGQSTADPMSLDGTDWTLTHASTSVTKGDVSRDLVGFRINATVPGGVWDNMERAGKVPNPLYRDTALTYANLTADGTFTFSKTFDLPATWQTHGRDADRTHPAAAPRAGGAPHPHGAVAHPALLELDGLQTLASIRLNGVLLGNSSNMFRRARLAVAAEVLRASGNELVVTFNATPPPPGVTNHDPSGMDEVGLRDEADAWGWDWSPSLNPVSIYRSVRLVPLPPDAPYLVGFSPKVSVTAMDGGGRPTDFEIEARVEVVAGAGNAGLSGVVTVRGDWGGTARGDVKIPPPPSPHSATTTLTTTVRLTVKASSVNLWWPAHYGTPALHTLVAEVQWGSSNPAATPAVSTLTKRIGFRSVTLDTGGPQPELPAHVDPALSAEYVGCFRDGNIWWGGPQHALPHQAATGDPDMTPSKCIGLCRALGPTFTLAGLQRGDRCYCGNTVGERCDGCFQGVGELTDPSECVWPCSGSPGVACGGGTYMWGANSVYNVTHRKDRVVSGNPVPPPPLATEGNGNSAFAVVVNGVKIFARGGNLVPFELLESTVQTEYIQRTVQSVKDGGMNMIRVWGGGMYQDDAFYDACDALGILIYHDAMFCERLYPHTPAFTASVVAELEDQVARVGHHPSIALWDANNENDGDPRFFYDVVLTTLARADGTRPLWPSSPSSGFATGVATKTGLPNGNPLTGRFNTELDTHMPYNYCNESFVTSTQLDQPTFFKSEFGQVGLPAFETFAPVLSEAAGDYSVFSPVMLGRKHAGTQLANPIKSLFGVNQFNKTTEAGFRRIIYLSQLSQTLCIKTLIEEFRRGKNTYGALLWQLNDVWQASSWGSLDYGGRWRALHHSFQATLAPTMASVWVNGPTIEVYASHHGAPATASSVQVTLMAVADGSGNVSKHSLANLGSATAAIVPVVQMDARTVDSARQVIVTSLLTTNGSIIPASETVHLLAPPSQVRWGLVSRNDVTLTVGGVTSDHADVTVANGGAAPVFHALITSTGSGRFTENLLTIPPKSSRTVSFRFSAGSAMDRAAFQGSLHMEFLNSQ